MFCGCVGTEINYSWIQSIVIFNVALRKPFGNECELNEFPRCIAWTTQLFCHQIWAQKAPKIPIWICVNDINLALTFNLINWLNIISKWDNIFCAQRSTQISPKSFLKPHQICPNWNQIGSHSHNINYKLPSLTSVLNKFKFTNKLIMTGLC